MPSRKYKAIRRDDYKAPDFTAKEIDLTFSLADEDTEVRSVVHYKRLTEDRKAPLVLDGDYNLRLKSLAVNGIALPYKVTPDYHLVVDGVPDEFELTITNLISPARNSRLMGLYKSCGCFCTQCEPHGFRRITYFLDRPDVLAKYRVTIVGPDFGCGVLLSNGNLVQEGTRDGRDFCVWDDPYPKPSYLFALVAGSFDIIHDRYKTKSGKTVELALYVDRGAYSRGLFAMEAIKQSMKWDEERFGLEYDLNNFKVVAVDFFNQGAMENKSLNIFNSIYVLVDPTTATDTNYYNVQSVIGHEYFHNYTGDRVTLRDWFQLSLKESLTVFRDQEFSSDVASRALTRLKAVELIRGAQFAEDASPMAHSVRPDEVMEMNNFYTVTIYDKGAEVIRMIHTLLGEEQFCRALTLYLSRHDGSAATIEDFLVCMEESSGTDLGQFRRWYTQAGTPVLQVSWEYQEPGGRLVLRFEQHTPPTPRQPDKEPLYIPVRTSFLDASGQEVRPSSGLPDSGVLIVSEAQQEFTFEGLDRQVLPVVLRDFSAPVRLQAQYTAADYRLMLSCCDDPFIKQNSALSLITAFVHEHIASPQQLPQPDDIISAFGNVMRDEQGDELLAAECLKIPSIATLMETFDRIDLDAIKAIHDHLERSVAVALRPEFARVRERTLVKGEYHYNIKDMARRALHNLSFRMVLLAMQAAGEEQEAAVLCRRAYHDARNMTLRLSALTCAVHLQLGCCGELLEDFEKEFGGDPLTFDNFFRVQATVSSEDTVFNVRKLTRHPRFDKTNPNRIRALVGAMALSNPVALHNKDGTGYRLLYDVVRELDRFNEHVAARILSPILSFRRFDADRQKLARECLESLYNDRTLSKSVFEKVDAALNQGED